MRQIILIVLVCAGFLFSLELKANRAKYVFYMIGDGLGLAQRSLTEYVMNAEAIKRGGCTKLKKLTMDTLPVHGMTSTFSYDKLITGSAPAGTALACGNKTKYGRIAMSPAGDRKLPSITEILKKHGMKIGIISSVGLDHATPACFYSHRRNRGMYYEIASDMAVSGVDFFGGGYVQGAFPYFAKGKKCPIVKMGEHGYKVTVGKHELQKLKPGVGKIYAHVRNYDKLGGMAFEIDRDSGEASLADFTEKAIELLDNPEGFFIVVEGGKIDWACHRNDAATMCADVIAFDNAVEVAYSFYKKHPQDTLIVVTGDHETGGLTIGCNSTKYNAYPGVLKKQKMSCLALDKAVAGFRRKNIPFKDALEDIKSVFGLDKLTACEVKDLTEAYSESMNDNKVNNSNLEKRLRYGYNEPFSQECIRIMNQRAGVGWTTFCHTATPLPTTAIGIGAEAFGGYYDNTDIPGKILKAVKGKKKTVINATH